MYLFKLATLSLVPRLSPWRDERDDDAVVVALGGEPARQH